MADVNRPELLRRIHGALPSWGEGELVKAVDAVFAAIVESLANGEDVEVTGFGKFHVRHHAPRTVNPFGREVEVPGRRHAKFVAGPALKRKLNGRPHPSAAAKRSQSP